MALMDETINELTEAINKIIESSLTESVLKRLDSFGCVPTVDDVFVIGFSIQKVEQTIKNECNVAEIPEGLTCNAVDMVCGEVLSANPHVVTKSQVGLGNVPNVTTNDQTPTYSVASSVAELTSGETLSVALGKIAKSISTLVSHIADQNNPHQVSKSQVGLSNVPNVTTNNQTPTYTEATELTELASGEKLSTAFGKLKLVVKNVISILKLLGTTDISTMGDGTVTGILKLIFDKLTWKNYKNAIGAVTIELPEDYNELLIKINIKSADIIVNVPVLYVELYDTVQSFRGGWRQQEANGGMVSFAASKTSISFAAAFLNEENVTTTTSWSVYYR